METTEILKPLSTGFDKVQATQTEQSVNAQETLKNMGGYEIAQGMSVEEMKALFFDADALRDPNYRMYQLNSQGHRYY